MRIAHTLLAGLVLAATPTLATAFERVADRAAFLSLVEGRSLVGARGVSLNVARDGTISGRGFGLRVRGGWRWADGYFCRTLETALRDFPEDCQTVAIQGDVVRFTAERGRGDVADLRLR